MKMKINYIVIVLIASLLLSCNNNQENDLNLPECINQKFEAEREKNDKVKLKRFLKNDEFYYWLNTGATAYDGSEPIFDKNCIEVCGYCGFCILPTCLMDFPEYGSDRWELVK